MLHLFIFLFLNVQICVSQNTINEYVEKITEMQQQIINWTYPSNSNSYVGKNFNPKVSIFDGNFDFIICGAGSSGSVIANRLSEISNWKILLLEAGSWENNITDIPNMAETLQTTGYNWGYFSVPQKRGFSAFIGKRVALPRGKAIGGSSVINFLAYTRGNQQDYNKWGEANPGWTYNEVLPYFKKSENAVFPFADPGYHGTTGPLYVEYSRVFDQLGRDFLEANVEFGTLILDYNAGDQIGSSILQMNTRNGRRDSAGKAFINPIKLRKNLIIYTETLITKLLIKNKNVEGVEYIRDGILHYATCQKEVVLSSGALNTPQILMLSGIGPKQHLKEIGISVVHDLPVGMNLWDHLSYNYQTFRINYTYETLSLHQELEEYLHGNGLLSGVDGQQTIQYPGKPGQVPDIEYILRSGKIQQKQYEMYNQGYTKQMYDSIIYPTMGISNWIMRVILLHPKSRGSVRLKSASPLDYPIIDPNYFSYPTDEVILANALITTLKYAQTKSMRKYNSTVIKLCLSTTCNCTNWGSKDFWRCMAINLSNSVGHYAGTAKMGPENDSDSVVGSDLKVHGIGKLRVADCSVIPVTISGHINAVANMIGEKASDIIKQNYL